MTVETIKEIINDTKQFYIKRAKETPTSVETYNGVYDNSLFIFECEAKVRGLEELESLLKCEETREMIKNKYIKNTNEVNHDCQHD